LPIVAAAMCRRLSAAGAFDAAPAVMLIALALRPRRAILHLFDRQIQAIFENPGEKRRPARE
jgi:hypothetical protein